jgi:hypothetical protein
MKVTPYVALFIFAPNEGLRLAIRKAANPSLLNFALPGYGLLSNGHLNIVLYSPYAEAVILMQYRGIAAIVLVADCSLYRWM